MFEDLVLSPGAILGGYETFKRWILTGRNDLLVQALWVIYTHLSLSQLISQSVSLFVSLYFLTANAMYQPLYTPATIALSHSCSQTFPAMKDTIPLNLGPKYLSSFKLLLLRNLVTAMKKLLI